MESTDKKKYRIVYDRAGCIGVFTCNSAYPQRWAINIVDAKADLVGGQEDPQHPGVWVLEFTAEELEQFKNSAEVCPVNVIHIEDLETGKRII